MKEFRKVRQATFLMKGIDKRSGLPDEARVTIVIDEDVTPEEARPKIEAVISGMPEYTLADVGEFVVVDDIKDIPEALRRYAKAGGHFALMISVASTEARS